MNVSIDYPQGIISTTQSSSGGVSDTYETLCGFISDTLYHTRESFLGQQVTTLLESLYDIFKNRREANWDGYNAEPIGENAYFEAMKLIEMLPSRLSLPEIIAEPNGSIGLEWYKDPYRLFVVTVRGDNTVTYAGVFGKGNEAYGGENFGESIPHTIIQNINRVYL